MKNKIIIVIAIIAVSILYITNIHVGNDVEKIVTAVWTGDNKTALEYLTLENVNKRNKFGTTALMAASQTGNVDLVKILVKEYNADVNVKNKYGRTALMLADYSSYDIMEILLSSGADVNVRNKIGSTTLMLVAGSYDNYIEVIKLLISYGADINAKDYEGKNAIDYAREASSRFGWEKLPDKKEIIKILSEGVSLAR